MSREIKFRVWDKDVCAYIDRKHTFDFTNYLRLNFDEGNGIAIGSLCPGRYIYEQYTGLKDKNGKEIYEGDIVMCYSRGKLLGEYQVIWNENCGGFECESLKPLVDGGDSMLKDVRVFNEKSIRFRVVGNIHENPELLNPRNSTELGEIK